VPSANRRARPVAPPEPLVVEKFESKIFKCPASLTPNARVLSAGSALLKITAFAWADCVIGEMSIAAAPTPPSNELFMKRNFERVVGGMVIRDS
jgi:hypothetical protein